MIHPELSYALKSVWKKRKSNINMVSQDAPMVSEWQHYDSPP